jgi:hypothetical protein
MLIEELRKTPMLPNIHDDAINAILGITQGNLSYATYIEHLNDFLRRSRQQLTTDLHCVRFINGLANFQLQTHAKSHRSHMGYNLKLAELQNFLNDIVTDSPHLGGVKSTVGSSTSHGRGQATKKRTYEDPLIGVSKMKKRNSGASRGRGRGRGGGQGGRGRPSQNSGRIDLSAIAGALTSGRVVSRTEGLYFKCHKKGHRLFQCPELKGKEAIGAPSKKQ